MKFELWLIGKTREKYWQNAENEYLKRLRKYIALSVRILPESKSSKSNASLIKAKESKLILDKIQSNVFLILLDEKGKSFRSIEFSQHLEKLMLKSNPKVIFLIGGAYGFDESIYERANDQISLSKMTFSHQMIRCFFLEQLYRAFSIINNGKYHNE